MSAVYPSLRGRTVLVTGGASGIGAEMVARFCAQQARVALLDRDHDAAGVLVEEIAGRGTAPPHVVPCDLRDIDAMRRAIVDVAAALGPIRVLVNNAADDTRHDFATLTPEAWDDRFAVNLRHVFFAAQAVAPGMAEAGGGAIVNLGSTSWMLGQAGMPAYTAAKSALQGLTRTLARELGPQGIRVTCVVPGWTFTERQQRLWLTPEAEVETMARQCIKRRLMPDDVAKLVLFLASDDAAGCTGQSYLVDLGMT